MRGVGKQCPVHVVARFGVENVSFDEFERAALIAPVTENETIDDVLQNRIDLAGRRSDSHRQ